ncbi:O-antigen ligase family protein [Planktomarina temperata]|nr:O-antigen ligase family protein [Planktomarina temperata]
MSKFLILVLAPFLIACFISRQKTMNSNALHKLFFAYEIVYYSCFSILLVQNIQFVVNLTEIRLGIDKLNPISFGMLACNYLIMYVYRDKILGENIKHKRVKYFFGLLGLLLSGSKSPFIAFMCVCILIYFSNIRFSMKLKYSFKNVLNGALVISALYLAFTQVGLNPFLRFARIFAESETSTISRLTSYMESINIWINSPLFGSSVLLAGGGYPHSVLFDVLITLGLVGLFSFLIVIRVTWIGLKRNALAKNEFGVVSSWFFATLVIALFSGAIHTNSTLFVLGAISLAGARKC